MLIANNCWHFNIYEQDEFCSQLSWAWKKFYYLEVWSGSKTVWYFDGIREFIFNKKKKMQTTQKHAKLVNYPAYKTVQKAGFLMNISFWSVM